MIKSLIKRKNKKVLTKKEKPRLSVFRSNKHIYAQIIDDLKGRTLAASSTMDSILFPKDAFKVSKANKKVSSVVGQDIARKALLLGIGCVVFDRGNFRYHGRVKALAESAREGGLIF